MRKRMVFAAIIVIALTLTGCGRANNLSKQGSNTNMTQPSGTVADQNQNGSNSVTPANGSATSTQTGGTSVVAKSGNIVSSKDKEALLQDVDKELDNLFNGLNSLDDIQDTDLNLN